MLFRSQRYANGETVILLVRRQGEPEAPFVTVEYRNGRMVQARAGYNGTPPKEAMEFLAQWESRLKSSEKKAAKQVA